MWRELSANKSRFASVFGIVLLGVMMLSGLLSVGPGMRRAGQAWYSGQNVFDLRVVSTLGLSQEDIDAIAAAEGVEAVMPVKQVDCEGSFRGGSALAVRVQQLPVYPTLARQGQHEPPGFFDRAGCPRPPVNAPSRCWTPARRAASVWATSSSWTPKGGRPWRVRAHRWWAL